MARMVRDIPAFIRNIRVIRGQKCLVLALVAAVPRYALFDEIIRVNPVILAVKLFPDSKRPAQPHDAGPVRRAPAEALAEPVVGLEEF